MWTFEIPVGVRQRGSRPGVTAGLLFVLILGSAGDRAAAQGAAGPTPSFPHFPDRLHAYVWRNWTLVPMDRLAAVAGAKPEDLLKIGRAMGLSDPPAIPEDQRRRSYITVIRRNWRLLPVDQIRDLLGWDRERFEFTLREDDFLWGKLGPAPAGLDPLRYAPSDEGALAAERRIAAVVRKAFPEGLRPPEDPPFAFIRRLAVPPAGDSPRPENRFAPRFLYSYFAPYGDPLLEPDLDPYPDGYLARLAQCGVDGVWLQGVLAKLSPFPWDPARSEGFETRRKNLAALVARARRRGVGVWLYLNEPRAMPLPFFEGRPELKGVTEADHAALCTSHPDVRAYLVDAVASLCRAVPDLAGIFTITASENLTNCWSHHQGAACPRCGGRPAAAVLADVNAAIAEGIRKSGAKTRLIAWDWGWPDDAVPAIVEALPPEVLLQSVSEWSLSLNRGGVPTQVGEYSISAIGPGPRAQRHWELARKRGMKALAKIQAGNTWELSAVPYIPAVENVARHAAALGRAGVDGLMLGWTLGGCPSPNLEVVAELGRPSPPSPEEAMARVARRRYGEAAAAEVVRAWKTMSESFREFPFHGQTVYTAPLQTGPANPLWEAPTGLTATMVGFPFDDLERWRGPYPPEVFAAQMAKTAEGFERGAKALASIRPPASVDAAQALRDEQRVAETCALHFRSVADQARFVLARQTLSAAKTPDEARPAIDALEAILKDEIVRARRLYAIQSADSRIGFEASNQYYYVPLDLVEKILNARDLLDRWIPGEKARWAGGR